MLKRKSMPYLIAVFLFTFLAALFSPAAARVSAAEVGAEITTVEGDAYPQAFTFTDSGKTLSSFTLPAGVKGYYRVKIPAGVEKIASGCFSGSASSDRLLSVIVPASVKTAEAGAFLNCVNLIEVCAVGNPDLEESASGSGLYNYALSRITAEKDCSLKAVSDENGTFYFVRKGDADSTEWVLYTYGGTAKDLSLPAPEAADGSCSSYAVHDGAFENGAMRSVALPEGVTEIGRRGFLDCNYLESVTLPQSLVAIKDDAFANSRLSSVTVPKGVTEIGAQAFYGCFALRDVQFEAGREGALTVGAYAFYRCTGLNFIELPSETTVNEYAFADCLSLRCAEVGETVNFVNTDPRDVGAVFFPVGAETAIVFPSAGAYDAAMNATDQTFKNSHADAATFVVNVNFYIGDSEQPIVYERLMGKSFNCARSAAGGWETGENKSLPVQAEHYASTVWYRERALTNKAGFEDVNVLLKTEREINLYCYETVAVPSLPAEPVSWTASGDLSYDISDPVALLEAMGCEQTFTAAQLAALNAEVVYSGGDGKAGETPDRIEQSGVYAITLSLNADYGAWAETVTSTVTVTVNMTTFTIVLVVVLIVVAIAVAVTVSTAVFRKKALAKTKKKQISSQEAIERYRAAGGKTTLK